MVDWLQLKYSEAWVKTGVRRNNIFLFACELSSGRILAYKMVFFITLS